MPNVILYHTDGCHLCEQAYQLIQQAGFESQLTMKDIIDSTELMEAYQTSIPVLEFESGKKLFWPFNLHDILTTK